MKKLLLAFLAVALLLTLFLLAGCYGGTTHVSAGYGRSRGYYYGPSYYWGPRGYYPYGPRPYYYWPRPGPWPYPHYMGRPPRYPPRHR